MIKVNKTKQNLKLEIANLSKGSAIKVWFECDQCHTQKLKSYRDCINGTGLCNSCHRAKRGKILGEQYGKQQKLTKKCLYCDIDIRSTAKTCLEHKKIHLSKIRSGSNNPAWTGNNVCKCGKKKSTGAKVCRECSFASGDRSGPNNGRWSKDKNNAIAAKVARSLLSNVLNTTNQKKNGKTIKILKYTFIQFKIHIENQFEPWMNWSNRGIKPGQWSVDHIIPVSVLVANGITNPSIINALWNLRPLLSKSNIQKSNYVNHHASLLAKSHLNLDLKITGVEYE